MLEEIEEISREEMTKRMKSTKVSGYFNCEEHKIVIVKGQLDHTIPHELAHMMDMLDL